ncbi:hypothetical protein AX15_000481 [Amanita polypyramis BW_CC]|nr:hypothetical protein AX15_000481 [Amanita polypyramis BW_CC]
MAFSQAHDFSITGSTFNDVQGNYNHHETTSNPQCINLHHLGALPGDSIPSSDGLSLLSVAGAYGSNIGGNQTNNIYITLPTGPGSYLPSPSSPTPTSQAQYQCSNVDISTILDNEVKRRQENLNWRQSIVDIMKILRVDSSLAARKRLATQAGYGGDQTDSRTMNIWLLRYVKDAITCTGGNLTGTCLFPDLWWS